MKIVALGLGMLLLALMAYLALWPVPIQPVSWKAPAAPGYVGPHAANQKLAGLKMIDLGGEEGPEHVVLARDGKLYTTVLSGNILRMNPDGSGREVFANTGGRVLGFDFRRGGQPDRRGCGQGAAVDRPGPQDHRADRPGGRRPDPLRRRRGGGPQRQDLPERRLDALRTRALGRHLRGQRARHHRAVVHRPHPRIRPGHPRHPGGGQGPELRQRRGLEPGRERPVRGRDRQVPRLENPRRGARA
jgi:hypothetical protein